MNIKKDKSEEFVAWMAYMTTIGEVTATAFFNLLCQNSDRGYDVLMIVSNNLKEPEYNRPYEANNGDIYLAMRAFSDFHENGDDFRRRWNEQALGNKEDGKSYAAYIERGNIKHVFQPFAYHSIFESKFFGDGNEKNEDDDEENYDEWNGQ